MFISVIYVCLMCISGTQLSLLCISGIDIVFVCLINKWRLFFEHLMFSICSEWTLLLLFWVDWHWLLFSSTNISFSLLLWFLITECDKGNFGEGCRSSCHCLNGVRCHNVNGRCPGAGCGAGWKLSTCSEGK
jgi:hypothetical protein